MARLLPPVRSALSALALVASAAASQVPGERLATTNNGHDPLTLGVTAGIRVNRVVIRNATIVSGRGGPSTNRAMPPEGPVDIVIENDRIVNIVLMDAVNRVGYGPDFRRPTGDLVIDATGMTVIPGLVEMHAHLPPPNGDLGPRSIDFAYRLYLGHGITTVRDAGTGAGLARMTEQRRLGDRNEIVAPRLVLCQRWPLPLRQWDVGNTPAAARLMVREFQRLGADCVKVSKSPGQYPDVLEAIAAEANALGMFVMTDLKVSESDAVVASDAGVRSVEHWYGVPDAALLGSQRFPGDYNYWDELDRFRWAGHLWAQANEHPERLSTVIDRLIANGTNWNPTMVVYEDNRDVWRQMGLPIRQTLMHPHEAVAGPDTSVHGAFKREWKTADEIAWRENFRIWMQWVRTFHERGGLLTAGSDEGGIGGIAMIRELELLQEAGIHPIDVIRVATTNAARALGRGDQYCGIRVGCMADLAVVNGSPVDNFKVMYGRGYGVYGLVPRDQQWRHGGVTWTIKGGVVFDAQALLREAEGYVAAERTRLGISH